MCLIKLSLETTVLLVSGFDPQSNDFKIVATTTVELDIVLSYMVYTLSADSWKRIP